MSICQSLLTKCRPTASKNELLHRHHSTGKKGGTTAFHGAVATANGEGGIPKGFGWSVEGFVCFFMLCGDAMLFLSMRGIFVGEGGMASLLKARQGRERMDEGIGGWIPYLLLPLRSVLRCHVGES